METFMELRMDEFNDYSITERVGRDSHGNLHRAIRKQDCKSVLIQICELPPGSRKFARLKKEYSISKKIDSGRILKPVSFFTDEGRTALALEDPGGRFLSEILTDGAMDMDTFLPYGIGFAAILGEIHRSGFVHGGINSDCWLIGENDGEVHITGFAGAFPLETGNRSNLDLSDDLNELYYISPEQTGRMNRSVDHRTDFYSLGVVFYEMLTGVVPFRFADPLEMFYHHIAMSPTPPREIDSGIPPVINRIILKLLSKNSDDRYSSAEGLKADLEHCREQLKSGNLIESFPLGRGDIPERLQIPNRLFGRDTELRILNDGFERRWATRVR